MATSWTNYNPTSTDSFRQLEPVLGYGQTPWGNPSSEESGLRIHRRGFGNPTTKYGTVTYPSTTWTAV